MPNLNCNTSTVTSTYDPDWGISTHLCSTHGRVERTIDSTRIGALGAKFQLEQFTCLCIRTSSSEMEM